MKEVDIVFFVEHVDRELGAVAKIADRLRRRGVRCAILSIFFHIHLVLSRYRARVFVFPFILSPNDWPVKLICELFGDQVTYVNMNWEQLLSPANAEYKRPRTVFQQRQVKHIAWDESFRRFLIERGVEAANVGVLGNPATQLLREQLSGRSELRRALAEATGLDITKIWLFFPMNYGWAFIPDEFIRRRVAAGYDETVAWEYQAFSRKNLLTFLAWVGSQARRSPEVQFIIRPHPSVSCGQYHERFLEVNGAVEANILITKELSVREWLPAADAVFSSWSTVALDAHQAGIPAYLLAPYARPAWLNVAWNDSLPNIKTEGELGAVIARTAPGEPPTAGAEGEDAIAGHAEFLYSLVQEGPPGMPKPSAIPLGSRTWLRVLKSFVYNGLFSRTGLGKIIDEPLTYDFFPHKLL